MGDRPHNGEGLPRLVGTEELIASGEPTAVEAPGSIRARLANAMVGLKKELYGRGPEAAKAWVLDDYVVVVLEGGLTRSEETLLRDGKEDVVRSYRLSFEESVGQTTMAAVAEIMGREVLTYHSQIVFHPTRAFELFVLQPEPPAASG